MSNNKMREDFEAWWRREYGTTLYCESAWRGWQAASRAAPAVQGEPGVKWAPEEVANGNKGIRWVSDEGVHGRPTDHDCRVYLESNPNARGCHCPECTMLAAAPQSAEQQPAPDVAGLVEALEFARDDLQDWMESFPDAFHDPTVKIIERIDAALAAHRKQEPSHD